MQVADVRSFVRAAVLRLMSSLRPEQLDVALPRVFVVTRYVPDALYPRLYAAVDALVAPTHGEGWGRPQFEVRHARPPAGRGEGGGWGA
jgi:glycosyltransferase involved in cell wall biosynthesis